MIKRVIASLVCVLCVGGLGVLAQAEPILTEEIMGTAPGKMMQEVLDAQIYEAIKVRQANYEKLKTTEDIEAYQVKMRNFFKTNIGGFPEPTPLNAKVVGNGQKANFRYEKIIYESQPGYYVTAILYLPLSEGPYPGILMPCGHSKNGKAAETYQRAAISLAMHGFATLVYDPVGQGERYFPYGENSHQLGSTTEHTLLNGGAVPTGANVSMYRIWDGMRGIDYLEEREDILTDKLGVTGNSGGGTLTSFIMALDDRVYVAAASCYLTDYKELTEDSGPHDGEQNTFNQLSFGMNHPDFINMRAPKPTLMCVATRDFFNINGAWRTYREAKRTYSRMGYAERVDLVETDMTHGFSIQLREGMVRWMKRWIMGIDEPVFEPDFEILTDAEALCSESGNVAELPGFLSAFDLNRQRAEALAAKRAKSKGKVTADMIRGLINAKAFSDIDVPSAHLVAKEGNKQSWYLEPEEGVFLPLEIYLPNGDVSSITIVTSDQGKPAALSEKMLGLLVKGHATCFVDLRGYGETKTSDKRWEDTVGGVWCDYTRAFLLGRSYVGMRSDDIGSTVKFIASQYGDDIPLNLQARGGATVPALHAAALNSDTFVKVYLEDGIPSWQAIAGDPYAKHQLVNAVHGALRLYDLPELATMIPDGRLAVINPKIPRFEVKK